MALRSGLHVLFLVMHYVRSIRLSLSDSTLNRNYATVWCLEPCMSLESTDTTVASLNKMERVTVPLSINAL